MQAISKWEWVNKWGEKVYRIPFRKFEDAKNFTKFIGRNKKFSLIGCHRCKKGWEVVYKARKDYLWQERGN